MTFKPMYDLESLNEEQREQYYLSACEHFGVPADLNLLAFIYMEAEAGKRNLVLYAKKGATDIIRSRMEITTTRLTKDTGSGYVAWIAEGKNPGGRVEMAVGSASTEGLKGQSLASAVMTAQTRATRRMTLQFVGGGLLDESEVNTAVTDIGRSGASLATLATLPAPVQPAVTANTEAGRDITPSVAQNSPKEGVSLQEMTPSSYANFTELAQDITDPVVLAAAAALVKPIEPAVKKRRRKAGINLDSLVPPVPESIARPLQPNAMPGEKLVNVDVARESPINAVAEHLKGTVTIAEIAEQVISPKLPTAESARRALEEVAARQSVAQLVSVQTPVSTPVETPAKTETPAVDPDQPSDAELKAWRARLFVYTNDVLPKGGMIKEEGIIWKVRKYVGAMFPDVPEKNGVRKLTNQQWKSLMETLDNILKVGGPPSLVKIIEEVATKA
jgi:hypothetical protein